MNSYNCTGHLIGDPVRRVTTNSVVATFRLAVDGRPKRLWVNVEAWGHDAGKVATYLRAGRRVAVTGRLVQDEYLDGGGHKQIRYKVVAGVVDFLDAPPSGPDEHEAAPQHPASFGVTAEHAVASDVGGGA
jgi:single-strand DNA-binding protein